VERQAGLLDLASELRGMVEVRGREPIHAVDGIAMLTLREVTLNDCVERRVAEKAACEPSKSDANREIAATATAPPGRATRPASATACTRSSRPVR
jgi:hypothetical protein